MVDIIKQENIVDPKVESITVDSKQDNKSVSTETPQIETYADKLTLEQVKNDIKDLNKDLKKSRTEYIQIFGVFAAIITLVGFNASAGQKGIWQIIVGNLMLGFVFIGFIYLLYVVPKKIEENKPVVNLKLSKSFLLFLGIILALMIYILFDRHTNFGLCSWYPLPHLELWSKIYCIK